MPRQAPDGVANLVRMANRTQNRILPAHGVELVPSCDKVRIDREWPAEPQNAPIRWPVPGRGVPRPDRYDGLEGEQRRKDPHRYGASEIIGRHPSTTNIGTARAKADTVPGRRVAVAWQGPSGRPPVW
jgi:hypothetical protein